MPLEMPANRHRYNHPYRQTHSFSMCRQVIRNAFNRWTDNTQKKLFRTSPRRFSMLVAQMHKDEAGDNNSMAGVDGHITKNQRLWRTISGLKGDLDTIYNKVSACSSTTCQPLPEYALSRSDHSVSLFPAALPPPPPPLPYQANYHVRTRQPGR